MNEAGMIMTPKPRKGFRRVAYANRETIADSVHDFNNGIEIKVGYFHKWVGYREDLNHKGAWALIETTNRIMEFAHYDCVQFLDN